MVVINVPFLQFTWNYIVFSNALKLDNIIGTNNSRIAPTLAHKYAFAEHIN